MTDPIRIISKARNNRLMEIRESMGMSVKEFAKYVGLSYQYYNSIENLSQFPGVQARERLATKLGSVVDEAFPEYLEKIQSTRSERTIPEREMLRLSEVPSRLAITSGGPEQFMIDSEKQDGILEGLDSALDSLTEREKRIICKRFGLPYPKSEMRVHTLEEIGVEEGVSKDRIRHIEARALRKLRHPSRLRKIRAHMYDAEAAEFNLTPDGRGVDIESEEGSRLFSAWQSYDHKTLVHYVLRIDGSDFAYTVMGTRFELYLWMRRTGQYFAKFRQATESEIQDHHFHPLRELMDDSIEPTRCRVERQGDERRLLHARVLAQGTYFQTAYTTLCGAYGNSTPNSTEVTCQDCIDATKKEKAR